ncbi:MAG: DUF6691 family protein [Candidatus Binatia bacterium]
MAHYVTALVAGVLFGAGVTVSQMVNPAKVLAFLDVAGDFDPSLALVMGAALAVTGLLFPVVLRRPAPVYAADFRLPASRDVDSRLLGGAALFGVGWGLAGYCPGPAVASLAYSVAASMIFVLAMIAGMAIWEWVVTAPRRAVELGGESLRVDER